MIVIRVADAEWCGNLAHGSGRIRLGSGAFEGPYDFRSRMGDGNDTNPEELLGAAHAGCFSMALALQLTNAGFTVTRIHTTAKVHFEELDRGWSIHRIELGAEASVPGITETVFKAQAQSAKTNCPVSRALSGVDIRLLAKLL